jgi:protein-tyrosine-phosphatase
MKRPLHIVLLLACALLATACTLTNLFYSNVGIAYSSAPPMLSWMVADYIDMSDDQKEFVRERVSRAFAWHRAQELPEYHRFFQKVLAQSEDSISVEEAATDHRELRDYYHRAVERLLPDMADFFLQLDSLQVKRLEQRFNKDNRKIVGDATEGSRAERQEKRLERFLTHLEQFTGTLNDSQRAMVTAYLATQSELVDERLADRRYRQSGVLALVRSKPTREEAVAELRRLFIDTESWRNADYQKKLRTRDAQLFDLIARLSASLTAEQRAAFQRRIRGFIRDITDITATRE